MVYWYSHSNLLSEIDFKKMTNGKKIILFGADTYRNEQLFEQMDISNIICIFDNDEKKWGKYFNDIPIVKPYADEKDVIIVSGIYDWKTISEQTEKMGYSEIYYFLVEEIGKKLKNYIEIFSQEYQENSIISSKNFKYIHIIPDEKFFKSVIEFIEYGLNIKEHFFFVYNMNGVNENDKFRNWDKYKELSKKYHNIYLHHNEVYRLNLNTWSMNEKKIDELLEYVDKIIFHGEWFTFDVYGYFSSKIELIKRKGVFIPWSGIVGKLPWTNKFIQGVLQYARMIVLDKYSYEGKNLMNNFPFTKKAIWFNNGVSYARLTSIKSRKREKKNNVLISHSCSIHTNAIETLRYLNETKKSLNIYSITSYGAEDMAEKLRNYGKKHLENNFIEVKKYMDYNEYVDFLAEMDTAVFGMDILLGRDTLELLFLLGVKVYLKPESSAYENMKMLGYKVYNYHDIKNESLDELFYNPERKENYSIATKIAFDMEKKIAQWKELYEYKWDS